MLNLNHLPPYYGPRMQTRMRERSQKYAWRGTSLDIRTYGRARPQRGRVRPAALARARDVRVRAGPEVFLEPRRVARADGVATEGRGGRGRGFASVFGPLLCGDSFRLGNAFRRGRPPGTSTTRFHFAPRVCVSNLIAFNWWSVICRADGSSDLYA